MNGKVFGLFQSSRGLKEGDPLSPTLFIIAIEVLTRIVHLNIVTLRFLGCLNGVRKKTTYHMLMTVFFSWSGQHKSMTMRMIVLKIYEGVSGQMLYIDKSICYRHNKVLVVLCHQIKRITGFKQGNSPFTYLYFPIFYEWKIKVICCSD